MGACDVVPGVSGGTMAFILGIYERLIEALRNLGRPVFLKPLFSGRFREAAEAIDLKFLLPLAIGIGLAILTLARAMTWLLANEPILLWSFFFGLIAASIIVIARRIEKWTPLYVISFLLAAVAAYFLVGLVPTTTPDNPLFVFLSGALAICAMILPGVSGSFILLVLGKYAFIVGRIAKISDGTATGSDFATLGIFGLGAVIGLVTFAQLLGKLFARYHDLTVAILTGLILGSLRKVWPWKEVLETMTDRHGEVVPVVEKNILPALDAALLPAIGLAIVGFILVLLLERLGVRTPEGEETTIDESAGQTDR